MLTEKASCSGARDSAKTVSTRRLRAMACAGSVCGRRRANSSPPMRKAESEVRKAFWRVAAAARTVEFFLERFGEEAAIVETGERIGGGVDLEFFVLVIFENDGNAEKSSG